jgi:predicted permease
MVAIIMLALGIAMSTSTFSITNSVLLSSLPFPDSERLVRVFRTAPESQSLMHSPANYLDIRAAATSFENIAAYYLQGGNVADPGQPPEQAYGLLVSANFLSTLGVQPFLGRGFAPDEDQPGKGNVVILTNSYWVKHFTGNPKVLGRTLRVGVDNLTVIGVLPPSFDKTVIWFEAAYVRPLTIWPSFPGLRNVKWYDIVGRIKPGVRMQSAQAELATIAARLTKDYPVDNALDKIRVTDLASSFVDGNDRKLYWFLTGMSLAVLLIACGNLASVQLARAFGRSQEFAIRLALGARRRDLMMPLLLESLLLALAGGILGLMLAYWANHLISHFFTGNFKIPIDGKVLLFAALAALLTGLTFGLAPAWLASRVPTGDALKESSRGSTSSRLQQRFKFVLIVGQLAFALVLVSAALSFGVAVKSALKHEMGFKPGDLLMGGAGLPYEPYKPDEKKVTFLRTLREKLNQIPGVSEVAFSSDAPFFGYTGQHRIIVEGAEPVSPGREPLALTSPVDAKFLPVLGIPLEDGHYFQENIKAGDPAVIIINETMARQYWPGRSAIGKRVSLIESHDNANKPVLCEIVGVVGDIRSPVSFNRPVSRLQIYRPLEQELGNYYTFVIKSGRPAKALVTPVRTVIAAIDPDILVQQVTGIQDSFEGALAGNNLMIITLGSFAFVGLLIAIIGLYGVIAQLTIQRRREIGIRIALGSDYAGVVRLILTQSGRLLLGGVVMGLAGAYSVSMLYRQTMPELQLPGAALQIGIAMLLCVVGLLACYFPARRAGRIDPVVALRAE